ncbi:coiled-coil domain-containing protein [Tepidimicrobium xylanilyticum]|uniref:Peptidoglycan hydrolase PcsB coiled-coil domain-containing protein n=1 Tax=Tepidimicrobium xylanilyticum TaxID=1123352 RepID=A0A1H2RLD1_9FIRM|nr:hypothetical protein [Tepidimicrobium xylanilyticum]GMG95388.1 hypothetical protein EN5CB1_02140 [Tepidimicrobium xylanilyticum]SDW20221.1 hypothetical protein SAMN05660923_00409 [Tepidimicrobium xylanilyticum]
MQRGRYRVKVLVLVGLILMNTIFISAEKAVEEDSIEDIEGKLFDISEEEREILGLLFTQVQEIEELERQKESIQLDIENMKKVIENLEDRIEEETKNYEDKLDILKEVLRSYQRMGPISYIQVILDADNITSLLRRVNILRDLTKNTGELLDFIQQIRDELTAEKMNLDEKLNLLQEKEGDLAKTLEERESKIKELEAHLASLNENRQYYEEQLGIILKMIEDLTLLIQNATKEFTHIIRGGNLPEEELELKLNLEGIKAIIYEDTFNKILQSNDNLPHIIIHFHQDLIEMEFPEENLLLKGNFLILDGQTLQLQVEEGNFYGFLLNRGTIDRFFEEGYFLLDISPILGKNGIKSIKVMEGYLELTVEINMF